MTKIINPLFRSNWFPPALQIITLGVFILLIAGGLTANTEDMAFAKVLGNTEPCKPACLIVLVAAGYPFSNFPRSCLLLMGIAVVLSSIIVRRLIAWRVL